MSRFVSLGRNLWTELRAGVRTLSRAPGFSLAAIAMLALGIGLSVAMYSAVHGMLLNSLPLRDGASVVVVQARNPAQAIADAQFTVEEAEALAAGVSGFERLAYYWWYSVGVFDGEHARDLTTHMVGPGYFQVLGVEPVIGRLLSDEDIREGRPFALLSHAEWQQRFAGSASVLGQRLDVIDDAPLEVIGVLPPEIGVFSGEAALWRPLSPSVLPQGEVRRTVRAMLMIGRLAPGTQIAQADSALSARLQALPRSTAEQGWGASARSLLDQLVGDVRAALWGALALALLVLLIGATNLALMLNARQAHRMRERAVLQALGATAARLRRAALIELALLSVAAVALGSGLAQLAILLLRDLARTSLARVEHIRFDGEALLFATALGLALPAFVMLVGARRGTSPGHEAMRSAARGVLGARGTRPWLPAVAVALATVSLVAALGLVGGLWRLQKVEPGYAAERVHVLQLFRVGNEAFVPFTERLMEALSAIPGVEQVALSSAAPLSNIGSAQAELRSTEDREGKAVQAGLRRVSPSYRGLLDITLIEGRDFSADDRRGSAPVALLSAAAARRLFDGQAAVGRSVELPDGQGGWARHEVVGVVADIHNEGLRAAPTPEVLVPFAQSPRMGMSFLVRSRSGGPEIDAQIRAALQALDPRQPVTAQIMLDEAIAEQLRPARFFAVTVGVFAVLALVLAAMGVYAVASLQQRRRRAEYGLRLAVGARPGQLATRALIEGVTSCLAGVGAGAVLAVLGFRVSELSALGVDADIPAGALLAGVVVMVLAALGASAMPALRVARTPPVVALRHA